VIPGHEIVGVVAAVGHGVRDFKPELLWEERRVCSVANLTREDGAAFMRLAGELVLEIQVTRYPMKDANRALDDLRAGRLTGAAVLVMPDESHGRR
jgi:propanol-preferring alcohol dehydrogenase